MDDSPPPIIRKHPALHPLRTWAAIRHLRTADRALARIPAADGESPAYLAANGRVDLAEHDPYLPLFLLDPRDR